MNNTQLRTRLRNVGMTFTLQSESTYDWKTSEWLAPINFMVAKIASGVF